ncbi:MULTISPECIES: YqaJ viral recombinase family protein [unclassified Polaromonas]|uniref:YqaJ viral recombinase family nuclease n=1 Tax=unclassified Polaromonas TaxID=2638319 RepID=UPI0018C9A8D5|nr:MULTISPECIES: YqaJ viral recombinase family protein [unclassified Polaromonas]MBG6073420.1 putative phage-type endonuclease [Polaromonas sp. CG_9.7]MBG6115395.1 putative phage-type endonuclease [Polaromonas sp. CG_9.2]
MRNAVTTEEKPLKPRPALKLVRTNHLNRDEWLKVRQGGIGSSDAGAAIGLHPYKSPLALWMEKTGRDAGLPKIDPNDETSPMYWGTLLESIVAAHYTRRTGHKVRRVNAVLQHPQEPWMLANIDREIVGASDVQILECKTAGMNGARLWKEGVPEYVQLQVMHQLAVTGKQAADVAVLICGQELQIHRIDRDEEMITRLVELERQFWGYVASDQAPPADGSDSADVALRALYPQDRGQVLDLSQESGMSAAFSDLLAIRQVLADNILLEAQVKQRIQQRMGEATKAVFETGDVTWKRSKDGTGLDVNRLLKEQPELAQSYCLVRPGSRRFLVNG